MAAVSVVVVSKIKQVSKKHYGARSPVLRETILQNLLKYNIFSTNLDDYSKVAEVI